MRALRFFRHTASCSASPPPTSRAVASWSRGVQSPRSCARELGRRWVFSKRDRAIEAKVPDHYLSELRHGDLIFVSEPLNLDRDLEAAIRQIGLRTIDWLRERNVTVLDNITAEHVGMVVADASGVASSVVEAARVVGVRALRVEDFFREFAEGTAFYHGQLQGVSRAQAKAAVAFAMMRTGAPYAHDFSPPSMYEEYPWMQAYYCSSLIDYAYREALGRELVFTHEPFEMIFDPPDFWEEYYRRSKKPVPGGPGSNPTLLLHSPIVKHSLLLHNVEEMTPYQTSWELF